MLALVTGISVNLSVKLLGLLFFFLFFSFRNFKETTARYLLTFCSACRSSETVCTYKKIFTAWPVTSCTLFHQNINKYYFEKGKPSSVWHNLCDLWLRRVESLSVVMRPWAWTRWPSHSAPCNAFRVPVLSEAQCDKKRRLKNRRQGDRRSTTAMGTSSSVRHGRASHAHVYSTNISPERGQYIHDMRKSQRSSLLTFSP